MPETSTPTSEHIDLRNPLIAGFLAWLIPGAGHLYQRRWAKGILFFVCLTGTFYYGIALGSSRTVYVPRTKHDPRPLINFAPQLMMGAHSFPAILQCQLVSAQRAPILGNYMAPPVLIGDEVPEDWAKQQYTIKSPEDPLPDFKEEDFESGTNPGYLRYAPLNKDPNYGITRFTKEWNDKRQNQYSIWNNRKGFQYDLGTTFTMIAGLLNLLVIFDAACGPAFGFKFQPPQPKSKEKSPPKKTDSTEKKA